MIDEWISANPNLWAAMWYVGGLAYAWLLPLKRKVGVD